MRVPHHVNRKHLSPRSADSVVITATPPRRAVQSPGGNRLQSHVPTAAATATATATTPPQQRRRRRRRRPGTTTTRNDDSDHVPTPKHLQLAMPTTAPLTVVGTSEHPFVRPSNECRQSSVDVGMLCCFASLRRCVVASFVASWMLVGWWCDTVTATTAAVVGQ